MVGDEATIRLDWARHVIEIEDGDDVERIDADVPLERSYEAEARHFLSFVDGEAPASVDVDAALASLRLTDAIRASGAKEDTEAGA